MTEKVEQDAYEYFHDEAYYNLWCVKRIADFDFLKTFHLYNEDEAKGLCELLNGLTRPERKI